MTTLDLLAEDSVVDAIAAITSPRSLRNVLTRLPEVAAVRSSLESGSLEEDEIHRWVADKIRDLRRDSRFPHEVAFAALAVAVERIPAAIADDYLEQLSRLAIHEMPLSPRVAKLSLEARRTAVSSNVFATVFIRSELEYSSVARMTLFEPPEVSVESHDTTSVLESA